MDLGNQWPTEVDPNVVCERIISHDQRIGGRVQQEGIRDEVIKVGRDDDSVVAPCEDVRQVRVANAWLLFRHFFFKPRVPIIGPASEPSLVYLWIMGC